MEGVNELDKFRRQWKEELQHSDNNTGSDTVIVIDSIIEPPISLKDNITQDSKECRHKNEHFQLAGGIVINQPDIDDTSHDSAEIEYNLIRPSGNLINATDSVVEYYPFKILTQFLNEAPKRLKAKSNKVDTKKALVSFTKRKYFGNELSDTSQKKQRESQDATKSQKQEGAEPRKNMLDIFLSDLDEINEIPFFDSTLPREVAIKIFQHLDMKSLCSCSQVSHSWKSLADDELLWFQICDNLGYESDLHIREGHRWKSIVQRHVEEKRLLLQNWKARIGMPYNLNFARGGVLCATHSFGSNIVAGYSSCNVRLWDAKVGDVCTFNASNTALVLDERAEDLGRIHNEIKQVSTTAFITTASFRHGFVDIWRNDGGTEPIHTCTFRNQDITSLSAQDIDSKCSLVASSQGTRIQITSVGDEEGACIRDFDMNSAVTQLDWLSHCQSNSGPRLLITCNSSVHLKAVDVLSSWVAVGQDPDITEVHNVIWAPVTSVGFRGSTDEVAVGFNFYSGPSTQIKVNIYDLSRNHLKTTLTGHTWIVSCVFMPDSLPDQLATGSGDRKIRLYDLRVGSSPATTLVGHVAKITAVEMDDWKVVSGDEGGFVYVWDQRMCQKLWDVRNRHPVQYCHFDDRLLIIGNVPYLKFPQDDEFETVSSLRYRGTVQVYDFLANQQTQGIPDICLSSYSEPEAYDYNIGLAVPYDIVS